MVSFHLIVGLGNPGPKYARHRHNIGFRAVEAIHARHPGFTPWRRDFSALVAQGSIAGHRVLLMKPQTYMNKSGDAVRQALSFFKLRAQNMTVIYDEIDLTPCKIRVKRGGGTGGHKGLNSIESQWKDKDYCRLRLGVGHPGHKDQVASYVLHNFPAEDELWIAKLLPAIADELPRLLNEDSAGFASRVCQSLLPAKGEGKNTTQDATQDATRDKTRDKTRNQNKAQAPAAQGVDCAETAPLNNAFAAAFDKRRSLARKG